MLAPFKVALTIILALFGQAHILVWAPFWIALKLVWCPFNLILAPSTAAHLHTLVLLPLTIGALCGCSYTCLVPFVVAHFLFIITAFGVAPILIFAAFGVAFIFL